MTHFKFFSGGRVLYVLNTYGRVQSIKNSWNDIYNAGLVYGVDGPGPANGRGSLAAVDQGGLFDWQGDTYRMRLMRGLTFVGESTVMTLPDAINGQMHDATSYGRCEYNDLVYPFCEWVPDKQLVPNWANVSTASIFPASAALANAGFLCQERDPTSGKVVMRGRSLTSAASTLNDLELISLVDPAVANGYFAPVIELME
ncbi:hypothetical protein pEaSNUABM29_00287 [Erwinia phage pEa_SNUABM_29]|nr:hypothetical protein pEaSNUABM29_00287 [Erwinia phage pEa_SNUABM_29]